MSDLIAGLGFCVAVVALVAAIVAFNRGAALVQRLATLRRVIRDVDGDLEKLEREVHALRRGERALEPSPASPEPQADESKPTDTSPPVSPPRPVRRRPPPKPPIDWEKFVGRRVLGWVAASLILLAAAFFIKYAFDTVFGPTARLAVGAAVGVGLCLTGGRYGVRRKTLACSMLCSAGLLILYLTVYAAFGYYTLLRPAVGGLFLTAVVAEGVLLSIWFRARPLAYVSVAGALLIPVLVPADEDRYQALFIYLAVVNAAAALLTRCVVHPGLRLLTYLGSQTLFWAWFNGHYHPEKMWAVIAIQSGLYAVWLLIERFTRAQTAAWERVSMWLATALCFFLALHRIVDEEAANWRGVLALGFAIWYTVLARAALPTAARDTVKLATFWALALGFLGAAIPLQSDAPWTAVAWAVIGASLWWFGLRVRELNLVVGGLVYLIGSLIALAWTWFEVEVATVTIPLFNPRSLPTIGVAGCLLIVAGLAQRFRDRFSELTLAVRYAAGLGAVILIWIVLTWETLHTGRDILDMSETGVQTALSIVWAVYAAALLAVGFALARPALRWTGLGLLVVTVLKLIAYDLSELPAILRALTFLAAAIVTAAAAWAYHRVTHAVKEADHD